MKRWLVFVLVGMFLVSAMGLASAASALTNPLADVVCRLFGVWCPQFAPPGTPEAGQVSITSGDEGNPTPDVTLYPPAGPDSGGAGDSVEGNATEFPPTPGCIEVRTPRDLDNVRNNLAGHYCQTANIYLYEYENWVPLGYFAEGRSIPFSGIYEGNNYTIGALTIDATNDYNRLAGLFYSISGIVRDLKIYDARISSEECAGVLACSLVSTGTLFNIEIRNSFINSSETTGGLVGGIDSSAKIEQSSFRDGGLFCSLYCGGLVGENDGLIVDSFADSDIVTPPHSRFVGGLVGENTGVIRHSSSEGTVYGDGFVGGLVGSNSRFSSNPAFIEMSWSSADVHYNTISGSLNFGGLVGANLGGDINRSFARGDVIGAGRTGGLVGLNNDGGVIANSYSTGFVTGEPLNVGGLVGHQGYEGRAAFVRDSYSISYVRVSNGYPGGGLIGINEAGTALHSYWDTQTSGASTSAAGEGRTTGQMKMQANYVNWDFARTWGILEGTTYPQFEWDESDLDLAVYYPFDNLQFGRTSDYSPRGVYAWVTNGQLTSGPSSHEEAFSFAGDGYIARREGLSFGNASTMASWVKLDRAAPPEAGAQRIISNGVRGSVWPSVTLYIDRQNRPVAIFYYANNVSSAITAVGSPLNLNEWYHLAAKLENNQFKLFVNGQQVQSVSAQGKTPYANSNWFLFGAHNDVSNNITQFLYGSLDDLRMYTRALSDGEIQALAQ